MRYDTGGRQGPYTACQEHPTKYDSPKKGSLVEPDSVGMGLPSLGPSVRDGNCPSTATSGGETPAGSRRPTGGNWSRWMTRARSHLKGDDAAARITFHIYVSGTVPPCPASAGITRGVGPRCHSRSGDWAWVLTRRAPGEGVTTWDERAVHERHLLRLCGSDSRKRLRCAGH
jgi:hypothetical protein